MRAFPNPNGARVRAKLARTRAIRQQTNRVADGTLRDALADEIALRQELEAQIRQMQKLEAIGRLAGGVAHDFNNLLTIIIGMNESVLDVIGSSHEARPMALEIRKAAERAGRLTRQLLAFSRRQLLKPTVLNLNAVVPELEQMLTYLVGVDINVRIMLEPSLSPISVDQAQLEQVLLSLVVNARDAMPDGGELVIETQNVELDSAYHQRFPYVRPGPYVMLAITDSGKALDPDTRVRLFEPFFTTKELGRGNGLGLAVVYGIVKQSGGYIVVDSEPATGTTFRLYFPQAAETRRPDDAISADDDELPLRGGSETVLVVEDEPGLLLLASGILEQHGYTVLRALNGPEALTAAQSHNGPIDLVLADVILPGMKGPEVADRIRPLRPGVRVMFMSGYTDNALGCRSGDQTPPFLQKPFTPESLCRLVRRTLDA